MCCITMNQELNVTRAGGCVIKSCESITTIYSVFYLEPDPVCQMDEVLCQRRLAS
jgi:hypothetical protein